MNSRLYLRYSYPPVPPLLRPHRRRFVWSPRVRCHLLRANSDLPTHKLVPIHLPIPTRAHSTPIPFSTREEERTPPKRRRVKQERGLTRRSSILHRAGCPAEQFASSPQSFDHISQYFCQLDWSSGGWTGAYAVRWPSGW